MKFLKSFFVSVFAACLCLPCSAAARHLPPGFYVESSHRSQIVYARDRRDCRLYVVIDEYPLAGRSFHDIVERTSRSNGRDSCTRMRNETPVGGPRFHCQRNIDRVPYTLHLIPYYRDGFYLAVSISGPDYPSFGITYDDVKVLIRHWLRQ